MQIEQLQRLIAHMYCAALQGKQLDPAEKAAMVCSPEWDQTKKAWSIPPSKTTRYVPLMIWGEAGVGKSQVVREAAEDLGIGFRDLRLALLDASDLIGLPREQVVYPCVHCQGSGDPELQGLRYSQGHLWRHIAQRHPDKVKGGSVENIVAAAVREAETKYQYMIDYRMAYSMPEWFPALGTHGILFLDEVSRSHEDIENAVFQLLLDRRLHTLELPDGWIIIAANNPPTKDYEGVRKSRDKAFRSRFLHIALDPTVEEWLRYAYAHDVDPTIRALISRAQSQETMLGLPLNGVPMDDSFPTPRTWMMLNSITKGLDRDLLLEVAQGLVGPEAATAWTAVRAIPDDPVRGVDVLSSYVVLSDGRLASSEVRDNLYKFMDYPTPVFDADGNERRDENGRVLMDRGPRRDIIAVTFDDLTGILNRPLKQYEITNVVAFLSDAFRGTGDEPGAYPDANPDKRPGLGMKDIGFQYLKFWSELPARPLREAIGLTHGMLRTAMEEAGAAALVAQARHGGVQRRKRIPGASTFGSMRPTCRPALAPTPVALRRKSY